MSFPFVDLDAQRRHLGPGLDEALRRVLEHGQFILGPEVAELEQALAQRAGVGRVLSCSSGTDALLLVLMAWGIGPGDAVIVPTFSFAASAEAVALTGATVAFADVERGTGCVGVDDVARAADAAEAAGLAVRALVPVDLFGQPADYDELGAWARGRGIRVLADAAQSFGARYRDRPVGSLADATATSFFPAKPLGCYGDGGAVFTDDEELAAVVASLRVHGEGRDRYEHVRIGVNGRLDTLQAAILLQKLAVFDDELVSRGVVADRYDERLPDGIVRPRRAEGRTSAWAQYTVRVDRRDRVREVMTDAGVPTAVYYPIPLHRQPAYRSMVVPPGGLPAADELAATVLSLPIHPYLSCAQQQQVVDALAEVDGRG